MIPYLFKVCIQHISILYKNLSTGHRPEITSPFKVKPIVCYKLYIHRKGASTIQLYVHLYAVELTYKDTFTEEPTM